jgi:hypothetical protein
MKQFIGKLRFMAVLSAVAALFSFSTTGGEGFEVFLDKKLILQQFGKQMDNVKTIKLDQSFSEQQLVVKYHHCGQVGKNRSITIRDSKNKVLKEWKYANTNAANMVLSDAAMKCRVKDIVGLQKSNPGILNLYYYSSELPKGRLLLSISGGDLVRR